MRNILRLVSDTSSEDADGQETRHTILSTADDRDRAAELRDRVAEDRDAVADRQDRAASDRDARAAADDPTDEEAELSTGAQASEILALQRSKSERVIGMLARRRSKRNRIRSATDRAESADDRKEASSDRVEGLGARAEADAAGARALAMLELMSDAFLTLDSDWRFTYLNPQTEAILDRRRDDLLGKNLWEEFPGAVGTAFDEAYRRARRDQVTVAFEEHYAPLDRTLEVRAYPIAEGLAIYFRDVSEQRNRQIRQRQTQRLEALGQVTAAVAHDFNNLLTGIMGYADLGRSKCASDIAVASYFEQIAAAAKTATGLTRQLLTFGREQVRSPELIDLNEIINGVLSLLNQLLPGSVTLNLALASKPVVIFADRAQVEQILINLVVNSRDAIDQSGAVTIRTLSGNPDGVVHRLDVPCGWLQVADTGSGIPEDVLPRIFDPYFSTKSADLGTGLGLATVYGIATQSGGAIVVNSTVGLGTTMSVAMPTHAPLR